MPFRLLAGQPAEYRKRQTKREKVKGTERKRERVRVTNLHHLPLMVLGKHPERRLVKMHKR